MAIHQTKRFVKKFLANWNLTLTDLNNFHRLESAALRAEKLNQLTRLGMVDEAHLRDALELFPESQSQINQDFFVLTALGYKRNGFFVEFGAADGKSLSNTWLLEKSFDWTGILAEPGRCWREALRTSGRNAALEYDCVWTTTGETLNFVEPDSHLISTIEDFRDGDHLARFRSKASASTYKVRTISLNDLLEKHRAPAEIDYLSIDTEGSEFDILNSFDFARYRFRAITCEHNFTSQRDEIHSLLTRNGYRQVFSELSQQDSWYLGS